MERIIKYSLVFLFAILFSFGGASVSKAQSDPWNNYAYTSLPASFDWTNVGGRNYITAVKDQGQCGGCWAFALQAALEANIQIYYNNSTLPAPDLSEEDLISCANPYVPASGLGGCKGATGDQIFQILSSYIPNTGTVPETCFPYAESAYNSSVPGTERACPSPRTCPSTVWKAGLDYRYYIIPVTDSYDIKWYLVNYGPVAVSMIVYPNLFSYTWPAIHTPDPSSGSAYGHFVLIVGYGTDAGVPYWKVKNSWGPSWGGAGGGYFKVAANSAWLAKMYLIGGQYYTGISMFGTPSYNGTYGSRACADGDSDGYCNWGLGPKPANCPSSCSAQSTIEDCDDSNAFVHSGCNSSGGGTCG